MTKRSAAIRAQKTADDAMDAYTGPHGTPEFRRLYAAVEAAYNDPNLPDSHRDPRDRANAHKLRCKCRTPRPDQDSYCLGCGCRTA